MHLEVGKNSGVTRPSLHRGNSVVVRVFFFCGSLASSRDVVLATVSDNRSGFVGNQDLRLFCFAAILFFVLVGSRHGCSIVG